GGAESDRLQPALPAKLQSLLRDIDAGDFTMSAQHLQIRARSAAYVQNSWPAWLKPGANVLNKGFDNPAPANVPPVTLFHFEENWIMVLLHFFGERRFDVSGLLDHPESSFVRRTFIRATPALTATPANISSRACIGNP